MGSSGFYIVELPALKRSKIVPRLFFGADLPDLGRPIYSPNELVLL